MPSLWDFNFGGDDPGPQTDPVPDDPGDGWEEAVWESVMGGGEDDRANYAEPGWEGSDAYLGLDPSVFSGEGDPDEPEEQTTDVPPVSTTADRARRWPYVVTLERCPICGRFKDVLARCSCANDEAVAEDVPAATDTSREHKPWLTYVDRCERCGRFVSRTRPHDCPVAAQDTEIPEVTAPATRFVPAADLLDLPVPFSYRRTVFDPEPTAASETPVTDDEVGGLARIRAELDEIDAASLEEGTSITVLDEGFWEELRKAIYYQASHQWTFIGSGVNDWTLAYGQRYFSDLFPFMADNPPDSLIAEVAEIEALVEDVVDGPELEVLDTLDSTVPVLEPDFADIDEQQMLEFYADEFAALFEEI